jgi:hypothetical protein
MWCLALDDPYEVATNFCTIHGLPPDYIKEQIIAHVKPMTDPAAYKRKAAEKAKQAEERKLIHVPSWVLRPHNSVPSFFTLVVSKLLHVYVNGCDNRTLVVSSYMQHVKYQQCKQRY